MSSISGNVGLRRIHALRDPVFFQLQWPQSWAHTCIAAKELLPIVARAALWGTSWSGKGVLFRCDNMAAVKALSSRKARDQTMSHLLRYLVFLQAQFNFEYTASHIAGKENRAADALLSVSLSHPTDSPSNISLIPRSSPGTSPSPAPVLDFHSLGQLVQEFFARGLSKSSMNSYNSAHRRYFQFCNSYNLPPLPLTELSLCLFSAFLAYQGLKSQSINA